MPVAFSHAWAASRASCAIVCLLNPSKICRPLLLLLLPVFRRLVGMTVPAGRKWTEHTLNYVLVANVLAKLAMSRLLPCRPNPVPVAVVAAVLNLIAHFSDLFFPWARIWLVPCLLQVFGMPLTCPFSSEDCSTADTTVSLWKVLKLWTSAIFSHQGTHVAKPSFTHAARLISFMILL